MEDFHWHLDTSNYNHLWNPIGSCQTDIQQMSLDTASPASLCLTLHPFHGYVAQLGCSNPPKISSPFLSMEDKSLPEKSKNPLNRLTSGRYPENDLPGSLAVIWAGEFVQPHLRPLLNARSTHSMSLRQSQLPPHISKHFLGVITQPLVMVENH